MAIERLQEYVRYIYVLSLASALAVTLVVDYILISLWLFGEACLQPLITTPILMFMVSMIVLTIMTILKQLKGGFPKLQKKDKALVCAYITFVFIALGYFAYASTLHYLSLDLVIRSPQLAGDHYLGFGLALFNAGLIATLWKLLENDNLKLKVLKAFKPFTTLMPGFKRKDDDEEDFVVYVR